MLQLPEIAVRATWTLGSHAHFTFLSLVPNDWRLLIMDHHQKQTKVDFREYSTQSFNKAIDLNCPLARGGIHTAGCQKSGVQQSRAIMSHLDWVHMLPCCIKEEIYSILTLLHWDHTTLLWTFGGLEKMISVCVSCFCTVNVHSCVCRLVSENSDLRARSIWEVKPRDSADTLQNCSVSTTDQIPTWLPLREKDTVGPIKAEERILYSTCMNLMANSGSVNLFLVLRSSVIITQMKVKNKNTHFIRLLLFSIILY